VDVEVIIGLVGVALALVTGVGGLVVSIVTARSSASKNRVDQQGTVIDNLSQDYQRLDDENTALRAEMATLREADEERKQEISRLWRWIDELFDGAKRLYEQVLDLGGQPCYIPRHPRDGGEDGQADVR
jgi:hypothetical protein